MLSSKANMRYSENIKKKQVICFNQIIWLIMMKTRLG